MKKLLLCCALLPALIFSGCGSAAKSEAPSAPAASSAASAPAASQAPAAPAPSESAGEEEAVDIDLTKLSSTMVYSEVYNMMYDPLPYNGMIVRMQGTLSVEHGYTMEGEEDLSQNYFYCVVADALACCAQGIEFDLAGDYAYPADYPPEGTEITVTGVFELYEDDGFRYLHLGNAVMEYE